MAHDLPDRFDTVPDDLLRTGAHRAAPRKGRGWIAFAWAALFTGILVAAGLTGLAVIRGNINLPFFSSTAPSSSATPTSTPTPTITPAINRDLAITVLNGTSRNSLATEVGDFLVRQGWAGAADGKGSRANAATRAIKTTVVYFGEEVNRAAAEAMVLSLKVGTVSLSNAYPGSPITVVLGSDFALPAN